jgi:hypothetical protein
MPVARAGSAALDGIPFSVGGAKLLCRGLCGKVRTPDGLVGMGLWAFLHHNGWKTASRARLGRFNLKSTNGLGRVGPR